MREAPNPEEGYTKKPFRSLASHTQYKNVMGKALQYIQYVRRGEILWAKEFKGIGSGEG